MQKNSYNYDDLISCGEGKLFGEGNAKLPLPPMLMFDRITEIKKDTALNYLSEFILFWKDNGAALKTWNVKFVDFVKRKEIGSYNSKNEPGKFTKTFKERKSDQSWAEEIE